MKKFLLSLIILSFATLSFGQKFQQTFVTTDLDNFWIAYDKIMSTKDSVEQINLIRKLYLDKATDGLKALREVRNYSEKDFIEWMTKYPKFWRTLKTNTSKVKTLFPKINRNIEKLKNAYPNFKPSTIYFSMGAFRTGGTIHGNKVLIGSELSLADKSTIIDEFPTWRQEFYKKQNPFEEVPLLCTHEYVHTQQKELIHNLLSMCLYEGVAEFISCKVSNTKSDALAIEFGKANEKIVVEQFVKDLFLMTNDYNWLYSQNRNELKVRDLGYYIGYEICERYYNQATDKQQAIIELIELDYRNEKEVERIVNSTKLLPKTLEELYNDYEKQRPKVVSFTPFENGNQSVKSGVTKITVTFSEPLNGLNDGIDFGPLGQAHCPKINPIKTWSLDKKSWTFEAELKPNQHYQILISNNFRKDNGVRLKSFLIDFKTIE